MKLSDKLSLYVVGVSIAVFIAITLIVESYAVKNESQQAEHITKLLQTELVNNLNTRLYTVEQNVKRTASELKPLDISKIRNDADKFLYSLLESDSIIVGGCIAMIPDAQSEPSGEWMRYIKRNGVTTTLSQLGNTDYQYTRQQWYQAPLQSDSPTWSQPYIDRGAGNCLMVTYAIPVNDIEGNPFCIVTADIALSSLDEELFHLIPYKGSYSFTINRSGRLLDAYPKNPYQESDTARVRDFTKLAESLQSGRSLLIKGKNFVCTFTPVKNIDLVVCTASPHSSYTSVTARIRLPLLLSLVVGFILLIAVLRITMIRAMRPLAKLTRSAIDIGNGDFNTPIPKIPQYSDLSQLSTAMEYMKDSISRYIIEIEKNTREREHIATQLKIARGIQRSLLPPPQADYTSTDASIRLNLSAFQESALEVGGDLYDYVAVDNRFYFIIADVSGKGIPAALMMSYVKSLFHFAAQQNFQPSQILAKINENMCADNPSNMFVTLLVGYIDLEESKLLISNGGHNPAILSSRAGCDYLSLAPGLPAGIMDDIVYSQSELPFGSGDILFMYTDGVSEAEDCHGAFYGQDRLLEKMKHIIERNADPAEVIRSLSDEIKVFSDNNYADDITMLCISASSSDLLKMNLKYEISELEKLMEGILDVGRKSEWSDESVNRIMLVVEEAVANIINYAPDPIPAEDIDFCLKKAGDNVEIIISDNGPRFNPLSEAPEVDTSLSLEQRNIGGLGIFMMRNLSESMDYAFIDNHNILKITIKI